MSVQTDSARTSDGTYVRPTSRVALAAAAALACLCGLAPVVVALLQM